MRDDKTPDGDRMKRIQDLLQKTVKQHEGGLAGMKGYHYQDFVAVYELIYQATRTPNSDITRVRLQQEVKDSFNDDLHVVGSQFRRHIQIKSVEGLSWTEKVRRQFENERYLYPAASLELCVHDPAIQKSMHDNRVGHGLQYVTVSSIDYDWRSVPYLHGDICFYLDQLSLMPWHPLLYVQMWNDVHGTWVNDFGRQGTLADVFRRITVVSGGVVTSLVEPTTRMKDIAESLNDVQNEFVFAADGLTLQISFEGGTGLVNVPIAWSRIDDEFWDNYPPEPWALFTKLNAFRGPIAD